MSNSIRCVSLLARCVIVLLVLLGVVGFARAEIEDHGIDNDKVFIQSASLAPNPFTAPNRTTLSSLVDRMSRKFLS